jgi:hypothetical protein
MEVLRMHRIALALLILIVSACAKRDAPTAAAPPAIPPAGTLSAAAHPASPAPGTGSLSPDVRQQMATQHAIAGAGPADVGTIVVKKAEGPEGRTVTELYAARSQLRNRSVAVRGKVVKVLHGIMGRTWIHVRDGTGTREKKDDDLTVTTADDAAVGEVVLVRGRLGVDVDLGAGYVYPVIIEEAKVTKEAGP